MNTLVEHYSKKEKFLKKQLEQAETIEQVARIIKDELQQFADRDSQYIRQLSVPQARRAKRLLGIMRACFNVMGILGQEKANNGSSQHTKNLTGICKRVFTLLREFVTKILQLRSDNASFTEKSRHANQTYRPDIHTDVETSLRYLRQALEMIDRFVATSDVNIDVPAPVFSDYSKLLEYLQCLLGDRYNKREELPAFMRKRLDEIPLVLSHYGIQVKYYDHSEEPTTDIEASSMFIFEPSLNPERKNYVTHHPAFIQDDRVILPGHVVGPITRM